MSYVIEKENLRYTQNLPNLFNKRSPQKAFTNNRSTGITTKHYNCMPNKFVPNNFQSQIHLNENSQQILTSKNPKNDFKPNGHRPSTDPSPMFVCFRVPKIKHQQSSFKLRPQAPETLFQKKSNPKP